MILFRCQADSFCGLYVKYSFLCALLVAEIKQQFLSVLQKQVQANVCVNMEMVKDALDQLRGAVMIVYPMGLPPYDPIRMEFEDKEDLSGTHVIT